MILSEQECRTAYDKAVYRAKVQIPGAQEEADALYTCIQLYAKLRQQLVQTG